MKKFKETLVSTIERTELDLEYPFYTSPASDERNDVEEVSDTFSDVPSLDITEAINILLKLKDDGSNRVRIAEHGDHHGYYFYGVKLEEVK